MAMQAAAPMGNKPAIKITDIKTFLVGAGSRNWLYVKIYTDQGIHGIGEAYSCGPDEATVKVIEDFKLWLIGQDPRNVVQHVRVHHGPQGKSAAHLESGGREKAIKRLEARARLTSFDARDDRLRCLGARGNLALRQAAAGAGLFQEVGWRREDGRGHDSGEAHVWGQ